MLEGTNPEERVVLLTGATGYVGGRLLKRLEVLGIRVRCLTRRPEFLRPQVNHVTQVVAGDVLDPASLTAALSGVDTAYYLIHAMASSGNFEEEDRRAAQNFASAAREAGLRRIIYLGGLGNEGERLSRHLRSRHEVGMILRSSGVQVLEFRASIIIGSGSLSFEMIRNLVERLPVMITPRWVHVPAQPIAIDDVLSYLVAALEHPIQESRIYEIGGPDQVSYGDLLKEYARQRGLRRWILPVPVLTPWLSSLWLGLVTPLYARVGRALIESIRHPTVVHDDFARRKFGIQPIGYREAVAAAMRNNGERRTEETRSPDSISGASAHSKELWTVGTCLLDSRTTEVPVPPAAAFTPIRRIGGATGWYFGNWLWRLRGAIDVLVGGVGMRRGRRDPDTLAVGEAVDWWRVEAFEPDRRLLLQAEMKLPGRAWLEFTAEALPHGTRLRQTAVFVPRGALGRMYWYILYPIHRLIFAGMLRRIAAIGREMYMHQPAAPTRLIAHKLISLGLSLVVCLGTAMIGARLTASSVRDWYPTLRKPEWTPPDWVFGPVWTILFVMMASAAWLVWLRANTRAARVALGLFALQLVLNVAWSGLFFFLRSPVSAFVDILLLWCAIVATILSFGRVSAAAAGLLIPYLLWVTYAAALNMAIWRMNT